MNKNMELLFSKLEKKLNQQTLTITTSCYHHVTKNVMEALEKKMKTLLEENNRLKSEVSDLKLKVNNLEKEKPKNNLVFLRLEEKGKTECKLVDYVKETLIETRLHITSQEISNVQDWTTARQ